MKMFVKEQFYPTKKYLKEIDNQSKLQRNKESIGLIQQQNKNIVEEDKRKATIICKDNNSSFKDLLRNIQSFDIELFRLKRIFRTQ